MLYVFDESSIWLDQLRFYTGFLDCAFDNMSEMPKFDELSLNHNDQKLRIYTED